MHDLKHGLYTLHYFLNVHIFTDMHKKKNKENILPLDCIYKGPYYKCKYCNKFYGGKIYVSHNCMMKG